MPTEKIRTGFAYRIDIWDDGRNKIVKQVAGLEDFAVARAAYDRACRRWPKAVVTLRRGQRVIDDSRRGA
jgi:hypothetical protein